MGVADRICFYLSLFSSTEATVAMAVAPDPVEKGLEELEDEITCPVCRSTSATPRSSLASTTTARSASDNWPFEQNLTSPLRTPSAEGKRFCLITTPINCPRRFRQPNERTAYKNGESAGENGSRLRNVF